MYKLKKEDFTKKEFHQRDRSYFIDIFRKFNTIEDTDYFYLPDEVLTRIKPANIPHEVYEFFDLVWSNEQKEIEIDDIVGSHDYRNYELNTWLANFLYNGITSDKINKYFQNPLGIFDDKHESLKVFEQTGKYYLADGHHRFSCFFLHYHILKSQNKLPASFQAKIKATVRVIPNDLEFIRKFVNFCIQNNLYSEDEVGIIPEFELIDSNPDNPIIVHTKTKIKIDKNSNLDEVLTEIKKVDEQNKNISSYKI